MRNNRRSPPPSSSWIFKKLSTESLLLSADELLAFSIICMILLDEVDGAGILEHPAEPSDPLAQAFAQGLLGADSAKSTTLLTLNLPLLPGHIRANAVSKELPKARSIGLDQDGHYRAAVLKEYPPALCRAMANSFAAFLQSEQMPDSRRSLPTHVKTRIEAMVCTNFGMAIGPDCVKG